MTSGQFNGNAIAIVIMAVFFNCPFVTVGDGATIGFACVTQAVPQSVAFTESGQRCIPRSSLQHDEPDSIQRPDQAVIPCHPASGEIPRTTCLLDEHPGVEAGEWQGLCVVTMALRLPRLIA